MLDEHNKIINKSNKYSKIESICFGDISLKHN